MPGLRICVLDAGPIIHLDQLGALDLLHELGAVFIPQTVAAEAEVHRPGVTAKLGEHVVPETTTVSLALAGVMREFDLQDGEVAALAWAEQFGADFFVSDDMAAREAATSLGYDSTGTLGVIEAAFRVGRLSRVEAVELLSAIPARSTLFIRPALLVEVIEGIR